MIDLNVKINSVSIFIHLQMPINYSLTTYKKKYIGVGHVAQSDETIKKTTLSNKRFIRSRNNMVPTKIQQFKRRFSTHVKLNNLIINPVRLTRTNRQNCPIFDQYSFVCV